MVKKIFLNKVLLGFLSALLLFSCSNDDDKIEFWTPPTSWTQGALILNQGSSDKDNSNLSYYDLSTNRCISRVFESANSDRKLGDTGNDLLVSDTTVYVAMYGSSRILVLNQKMKVITTIDSKKGTISQKPRSFAQDNNFVYVTYYDGYLARIDKKTNKLDETQVKVGNYPEGLTVANGNIYVANSGGLNYPNYDKTVSVVNASSFVKTTDVKVIENPTKVEADDLGNVYVISMGNYGSIPNTLQRINIDLSVDSLGSATLMTMNAQKNKVYTIYAQYGVKGYQMRSYDVAKKEYLQEPFVEDTEFKDTPYSLNIDPKDNSIYIGTSDYKQTSTMYRFTNEGRFYAKFNTRGINPTGIFFLN